MLVSYLLREKTIWKTQLEGMSQLVEYIHTYKIAVWQDRKVFSPSRVLSLGSEVV